MSTELSKREWYSPQIWEPGATVADVRRSIRRAADVWVCLADGRHLKIAKAAMLASLRNSPDDRPLSAKFYIAGDLDGSVWIGG